MTKFTLDPIRAYKLAMDGRSCEEHEEIISRFGTVTNAGRYFIARSIARRMILGEPYEDLSKVMKYIIAVGFSMEIAIEAVTDEAIAAFDPPD